MKKILFVITMLAAVVAVAAGIRLKPAVRSYKFTNCQALGSPTQFILDGDYLLTVADKDTVMCFHGPCDGGNADTPDAGPATVKVLNGMVMVENFMRSGPGEDGGTWLSCHSSDSTGDLEFTLVAPGN